MLLNSSLRSNVALCCLLAPFGCSEDPPATAPAEAPPQAAEAPKAAAPLSPAETYERQAKALMAAIKAPSDDATVLGLADELTKTGLGFLSIVEEKHPVCKEYLAAVAAVGLSLKTLPLEAIETGYHADGKLPKIPDPNCYHGKDLVVHPATVAAMATLGIEGDEGREAALDEITEVLGHLSVLSLKEE